MRSASYRHSSQKINSHLKTWPKQQNEHRSLNAICFFFSLKRAYAIYRKPLPRYTKLTKEGEMYAEVSLPERQIINSITSPVSLSELKKKFPPQMVGIALGWLRKKKWAKIEGDI